MIDQAFVNVVHNDMQTVVVVAYHTDPITFSQIIEIVRKMGFSLGKKNATKCLLGEDWWFSAFHLMQ